MENMNQIWGPYLALLRQDEDTAKLHYSVKNSRVSPYLELQADSLHGSGKYSGGFSHLDVNPYVRFFSIFDSLLTPDDLGYEEFNEALADVILHWLAGLDIRMGMCRQDFYIQFLMQDMEQGAFGGLEQLAAFTVVEKRAIAWWLLCFYQTGDGFGCLSQAAKTLLPSCESFIRDGEEIVFYMREPRQETEERRLLFLIRLFLPFSCAYTIHWTKTYGVIDYEETMRMGSFLLA